MDLMEWSDSYSVGVEEIDFQHKAFLALINRLSILQERGTPLLMTHRMLLEVLKYAEYHFVSEENLMMLTEYPMLSQQQEAHNSLLRALTDRYNAFAKGEESLDAILVFLVGWFSSHTVDEDKAAGLYINKYARERAVE